MHNTYIHACIHTYIVLPVLSARRYIHTFSIHAYLTWDTYMPHSAPISDRRAEWRAEWRTYMHTYIMHTYMHAYIHI